MRKLHALTAAMLGHLMASSTNSTYPTVPPQGIPSYMMGHFGQPMISGNGKSRKKKSNKLHRSRMLRRKHARKNR